MRVLLGRHTRQISGTRQNVEGGHPARWPAGQNAELVTTTCFGARYRRRQELPAPGGTAAMRALIVDDEAYSREALRDLCEADESLNEVAVAGCGATAIKMIRAARPDLLLLDVELSDMTGFDVLRSLNVAGRPQVIMVSAHEEHAV